MNIVEAQGNMKSRVMNVMVTEKNHALIAIAQDVKNVECVSDVEEINVFHVVVEAEMNVSLVLAQVVRNVECAGEEAMITAFHVVEKDLKNVSIAMVKGMKIAVLVAEVAEQHAIIVQERVLPPKFAQIATAEAL